MRTEPLVLPTVSAWSDDRLCAHEPRDFAEILYQRALNVAEDLYDPAAYELVAIEPSLYQERLVFYLRRRAWAEWYFGVETPARQLTMLSDNALSLKLRLAYQITDEVRHHRLFTQEVRIRHGETRLDRFPVPSALLQMQGEQLDSRSPSEIAAANQFSGEIVLLVQASTEGNVLRLLLEEDLLTLIADIENDEPAHIALGRDLIIQSAVSSEERRRIANAQERFLRALVTQHAAEIEMLGSRRIRPLPSFVLDLGE